MEQSRMTSRLATGREPYQAAISAFKCTTKKSDGSVCSEAPDASIHFRDHVPVYSEPEPADLRGEREQHTSYRLASLERQLADARKGLEEASNVICGEFCSPSLNNGRHHIVCAATAETLERMNAVSKSEVSDA